MSLFRKKTVEAILANLKESENSHGHESLGRHLGVRDLAAFGIAAIIGAGIFSTIGTASADGGPAVIFLFLFTSIACGFAAFAYAEFASMVPVAGSAYTYSYVAFGEIIAWIIGWSLIMEYAIGNITVAISWSDYFTGLLTSQGINVPLWIQMDYLTASNGFEQVEKLLHSGIAKESIDATLLFAHDAWAAAPTFLGLHIVADIPALGIIVLITWLVYRGMKESRNASNAMVVVKLAVILLVVAVGVFHIDVENWSPFAPNGVGGVLKGVSAVFFAYIGFDAISTTAEECKDPQRDLPRGMMWAIIICTILYIIIALVLTGMVSYKELGVGDPLAFVFEKLKLKWLSGIIAVSAVVAMASVLLVFQMGQPRIWLSMSRDGLLPKRFSKVHPKYKTPSFSTIVVGFVVAVPALFMNLTVVTDLCSIGTLFAFVLVCAGVLVLQNKDDVPKGKFKTPYVNAKWIFPILLLSVVFFLSSSYKKETSLFLSNTIQLKTPLELIEGLEDNQIKALKNNLTKSDFKGFKAANFDVSTYLDGKSELDYVKLLQSNNITKSQSYWSKTQVFLDKIPTWIFIITTILLAIWAFRKNLSLIPLLGLVSCLYMMSQLNLSNWMLFFAWLCIGLVVYFSYGRKHSKLAL